MELRQLHTFVVLAEELHFGRAAERLHIVQPAVSQQLRRLEAELGATLVERSTRRVVLTDAGLRFLPEARAVLAAAGRARASVARDAARRTVRLGTSTGVGARLPRLLVQLRRRLPDASVELVRIPGGERLRRVADGTLDAALLRGAASHAGVRAVPVWSDPIAVALPRAHPHAGAAPLELAALAQLPVRLPVREENPALVELVVGACRTAGFEPRLAPAMNDQDMLAAIAAGPPTWTVYYAAQVAVLAGVDGVAFCSPTEPPLEMPTLLAVPADGGPLSEALVAACRAVA